MKQIQSVAIIGAGALGLLYMDSIAEVLGEKSFFLVDDKRYGALKNKTFMLNSRESRFTFHTTHTIEGSPDLIIVAVKNQHLDVIAPLLTKVAGPDTIILSVLNGIGSEPFLKALLPDSTVLYCAVLGMDAVKENDSLNFTRKGKFLLGTADNSPSPALEAVTSFMEQCTLEYLIPDDINREIWYKWMINIGVNQVSALSGAPYGAFQNDRVLQILMENAMRETIDVAKASGVNLCEEDLNGWYKVLNTLGAEGKTSMLQDVEAMRKSEVDSFSGELIKRAEKLGVAVPVNDTLYRLIKTKESLYSN